MAALRVLVCEDSRAYAAALNRTLEYDGDIEVLAVCGTAEEAIAALPRVQPDLVTMDVELPGMDGLEAVGEIMGSRPVPILVLSGYVGHASEKTAAALAAGALAGAALGQLWLWVYPGGDIGLYALLGAGAMLAASTQGPDLRQSNGWTCHRGST